MSKPKVSRTPVTTEQKEDFMSVLLNAEYEGSANRLTVHEKGILSIEPLEFFSIGDRGRHDTPISGKGDVMRVCMTRSHGLLITAGIRTHFVKTRARSVLVNEYALRDKPSMSGFSHGRRIPAEFVWSSHLEGSLLKAVFRCDVDPVELGFEPGYNPQRGDKLPKMRHRVFTKLEPTDRLLCHEEAMDITGLTEGQLLAAQQFIEHGQAVIELAFNAVGLSRRDGKCELAVDKDGNLVFIDSTGDPDNDRIGMTTTDGVWFDLSKQFLRDYFTRIGFSAKLKEAQNINPNRPDLWPDYPPGAIPQEVIGEASRRYGLVGDLYGLLDDAA